MKIALISDLHANLPALDAVLAEAAVEGVDRIVCLGDVVDLGPQPAEVVDRLRELECPIVRGNHDPLEVEPPVLAELHRWSVDALGDARLEHLRGLPSSVRVELSGGRSMLCVHGSPRSDTEGILASSSPEEIAAAVAGVSFDVLACGHTHLQLVRRIGRRTIVNVGSVGMPFERPFEGAPPRLFPWAEYGLVHCDDRGVVSVELRRTTYDFEAFEAAVHRSGMPDPDAWLAQWWMES